jgi:Kdo2-lipid IVA lauroyltransferase/acyltransferase
MRFLYYLFFRVCVFILGRVPACMRSCTTYCLVFVFFNVLRVGRSVVLKNLQICFPDDNAQLRLSLAKEHYFFMCETMLENFYLYRLSAKQAKEHIEFLNIDCVQQYLEAGQSVVQWCGHFNNFEYGSVHALFFNFSSAYKPLSNQYIDNYIKCQREAIGTELVPSHLFKTYCSGMSSRQPAVYQFIADQRANPKRAFMLDFFSVTCPFFKGAELIAKRNQLPMVYLRSQRLGFARYRYEFVPLDADASSFGARTQQAVKLLEADIKNTPANYYWTYKVFKYVSRVNYGFKAECEQADSG